MNMEKHSRNFCIIATLTMEKTWQIGYAKEMTRRRIGECKIELLDIWIWKREARHYDQIARHPDEVYFFEGGEYIFKLA